MTHFFINLSSVIGCASIYYENTPMQYTAIFHCCKNADFQLKLFDYFHVFAMFCSKKKKNMYTRVNPTFSIYKWGVRGCSLHGHVILMIDINHKGIGNRFEIMCCKWKSLDHIFKVCIIILNTCF